MLIHAYREEWIQHFQVIHDLLQAALVGQKVSILHVGSTAVPRLAAKAIIDIDVIYPPAVDFQDLVDALAAIGYYHNGDQGIPDREAFKRKNVGEKHAILDQIPHHLYVCPYHGEEWQRHVLFRDYLRQYEWARTAYEELKMEIAEEASQNRSTYAEIKEAKGKEWINSIIEKARQEEQDAFKDD